MKFIHISDLHLGKSLCGVSMIDQQDQGYFVEHFLELCEEINPDAVVLAGDIYDRSSPSADAVLLFDHLITELSRKEIPVMVIAGNHDSGERLSFASELLTRENVHISGVLEKKLNCVTLPDPDGKGPVHFWMMPYLFPSLVAQKLEDDSIHDYDSAVRALLAAQDIHKNERNVLIAHQNVTAGGVEVERGGSESMVGGVGQIEYTAFDDFDYVALGHIHAAYPVGRPEVRYAGSPLYYHFDELRQKEKGPLLVELAAKGEKVKITPLIMRPLHPLREIKGSWDEVKKNVEEVKRKGEYLRVVLNDRRVTPQLAQYLRDMMEPRDSILMELVSEYKEYGSLKDIKSAREVKEQPLEELFEEFYSQRKLEESPSEEELSILHQAGELSRKSIIAGKKAPDEADVEKLLLFVLGQEV